MNRPYRTFDRFYPRAGSLRAVFDERFANPLVSHPSRFQWDYWHVPGEYTLLRTPAYTYFPAKIYEHFHRFLVNWGREHLGCHDISPPWLSCYIDGCRQEEHQDIPHGPLAFVYSLTPRRRRFGGGETFLRRPRALITPEFNRLTVFNPALVHGVRKVYGTHDPRHGRLVVHGWFVNPRPFWVGPLRVKDVREAVERSLPALLGGDLRLGEGLISLRLRIGRGGNVLELKTLVNTLSGGFAGTGARGAHLQRLLDGVKRLRLPARRAETTLTLPLMVSTETAERP